MLPASINIQNSIRSKAIHARRSVEKSTSFRVCCIRRQIHTWKVGVSFCIRRYVGVHRLGYFFQQGLSSFLLVRGAIALYHDRQYIGSIRDIDDAGIMEYVIVLVGTPLVGESHRSIEPRRKEPIAIG